MEKTIYEAQVQVVEPRWEIESGFEETERSGWIMTKNGERKFGTAYNLVVTGPCSSGCLANTGEKTNSLKCIGTA